jgi:hypothetical protein
MSCGAAKPTKSEFQLSLLQPMPVQDLATCYFDKWN